MNYIVRSGALLGFAELAEERGANAHELLQATGLPAAVLHDPDLYIPYAAVADLLARSAQHSRTPDFGVRLGGRQGLEVVGALGSWLCLQAKIGDALALMRKNLDFHARGVTVAVDVDPRHLAMTLSLAFSHQRDTHQLLALSMALLARCLSQLVGRTLPPLEVALALPKPHNMQPWQRAFSCSPRFDAPTCRLVYPAHIIDWPVNVDPALRMQLASAWRNGWTHRPPISLREQVDRAIVALLPTGECNLEQVAHIVGLHPRTLQTRLKADAHSFGQVLRDVREKFAREHLSRSDIDLTSLAMHLGFAELAAFSRAFKSWTGMAPRQWRNQTSIRHGASAVSVLPARRGRPDACQDDRPGSRSRGRGR